MPDKSASTDVSAVAANPPSICILTLSYAADIERFALLRHSLDAFAAGLEHVAIIDTEDLPLFRQRFAGSPRVRFIPTSSVLPAGAERQRRFWRGFWGRNLQRLEWRARSHARFYSGWKMQQIAKIRAAARLDYDAFVFLDSDTFVTAPIEQADFFDQQGRLLLRQAEAKTYEDFAFEVGRQIFFRKPLTEPALAFNYIVPAPRFRRKTAQLLEAMSESVHEDWIREFYKISFPSEYNLLGYIARDVENYGGYKLEDGSSGRWGYDVKHTSQLIPALEACEEDNGSKAFFLVQSNMKSAIEEYKGRALAMIEAFRPRA